MPLHVDKMEKLGLDTKAYAQTMADALAIMLWGAGIDAGDVEFVLAPTRDGDGESGAFECGFLGTHGMWILDFDCCRVIERNGVGVERACGVLGE